MHDLQPVRLQTLTFPIGPLNLHAYDRERLPQFKAHWRDWVAGSKDLSLEYVNVAHRTWFGDNYECSPGYFCYQLNQKGSSSGDMRIYSMKEAKSVLTNRTKTDFDLDGPGCCKSESGHGRSRAEKQGP